jgi:murein L,D-transpeptidase YcbB/YkuD
MSGFRALASLPAFLILASGTLAQAQVPPDVPSPELQAQVEALVESGPFEIHGARIAHPKLIHAFYAQRSFRPAWGNAHTASELRRAVKDSEADGLDPRDYHLAVLEQLAASSAGAASTSPAFEILHTDALLRLGDHLSFGKVDPTSFDSHWNYGRARELDDVPQRLELGISGAVYEELEKLKPTHRMYRTLKQELARYRATLAETSQINVPTGKSIEPDTHDARIPSLRARLSLSGDLDAAEATSSDLYDPVLQAAIRRFQERMGLTADGNIGARTIEELNVSLDARIQQVRVNLDRGRVLLQDLPDEFVVVNIAAYWIYFVRGQEIVWSARAQVGKTYRQTPMFRSAINYLVLNPTWTVPPGILRNDILPAARKDPASITRRGLNVYDGSGNLVDPHSVDWSKYKSGHIPYTLRQEPGPKNALGRVKFMFPNSYSVYLHDTSASDKFEAGDRAFSSGCVRVDRPLELARLLLADPVNWDDAKIGRTVEAGRTQNVTLPVKVPVLLAYWTAWVDPQGRINFRRDVYGQDAKWAAGLAQAY